MNTTEIILDLINQKGITKNKLLSDLGLNKNSFVNWEKRGTSPSGKTLSMIAEYFDVTTDYLIGRVSEAGELIKRTPGNAVKVIDKIVSKSPNLSDEENEILKIFQALNKEGQEIILNTARGLEASGRYKKLDSSEGEETS